MKVYVHLLAEKAVSVESAFESTSGTETLPISVPIRYESPALVETSGNFRGEILLRDDAAAHESWRHAGLNE